MNFKKLLMIPLFAAMAALTGCGGNDCKSVCEDANDCDGAEKVDCGKQCDELEKAAKETDCEDEFDDLWDCAGDEDVCKADSSACSSEASAMVNCVVKYCTAHSTAAACTSS